jgi:hypothetical protein
VNKKQTQRKKRGLSLGHYLRHTFVPHRGNHFRPHLVRLHGVTAVLVLALLMQFMYGYFSEGRLEVLGRVSNITVSELLTDTNVARKEASLPDLKLDEALSKAAFLKAQDMLANNYWSHTSPSGTTPWKWLADVGYNYDVAGENLAKNYPTAAATVDAWMVSETHRGNILNTKYQDVGFAIVDGLLDGRDATVVVAFYGLPADQAVQGTGASQVVYAPPVNSGIGNPLAFFGTALQSLSPATLGALALLGIVGLVALVAHQYRQKLPAPWRRSWRKHHGMITLGAVIGLGLIIVFATGGGQI